MKGEPVTIASCFSQIGPRRPAYRVGSTTVNAVDGCPRLRACSHRRGRRAPPVFYQIALELTSPDPMRARHPTPPSTVKRGDHVSRG